MKYIQQLILFASIVVLIQCKKSTPLVRTITYDIRGCDYANRQKLKCSIPEKDHCVLEETKINGSNAFNRLQGCAIPITVKKGNRAWLTVKRNSAGKIKIEAVSRQCSSCTYTMANTQSDDQEVSVCVYKTLCYGNMELVTCGQDQTIPHGVLCKCKEGYYRPESQICDSVKDHCKCTLNGESKMEPTRNDELESSTARTTTTRTMHTTTQYVTTQVPNEPTGLPTNVAKSSAGKWIGITVGVVVFIGAIIAIIVWKKRKWLLALNRRVRNQLRHSLRKAFCGQDVNPGQATPGEGPRFEVDASLLCDTNSETAC